MTVTPFDYSDLVASADELIQEFGRQVTFVKQSTTAFDATKPWRKENTTTDVTLTDVWAALVPYESEDDKDSVRFGIKMCLVSGSSFPDNNGEAFDLLIEEDGAQWHLHDAQVVNPGGTRVLYIIKAEQ